MIRIIISGSLNSLIKKLESIDKVQLSYNQATGVAALMRDRIFSNGKATDNSLIGTYSDGYMKVRTNSFASQTIQRGQNKGKKRKTYNVGGSTNVILTLTREMQNDFGVIQTQNYSGVGFIRNTQRNGTFSHIDIAKNAERIYGKRIFSLSETEKEAVKDIVKDFIQNAIR